MQIRVARILSTIFIIYCVSVLTGCSLQEMRERERERQAREQESRKAVIARVRDKLSKYPQQGRYMTFVLNGPSEARPEIMTFVSKLGGALVDGSQAEFEIRVEHSTEYGCGHTKPMANEYLLRVNVFIVDVSYYAGQGVYLFQGESAYCFFSESRGQAMRILTDKALYNMH